MEIVTQINLDTANVPNALSRIGDKLRGNDVNIDAISCTEGGNMSKVHIVTDDPDTASMALQEFGSVTTSKVLAFHMRNQPGAIGQIGRAIGAANVNIKNMYATTKGREATVFVDVEDVDAAVAGMNEWQDTAA